MYKERKVLLIAPAYNEEGKIVEVIRRTPDDVVDEILVVDDGSTDGTASEARNAGARVAGLGAVKGVGYAIRHGFHIAIEEGFDIAVVIAGNNKDNPREIRRLLDPICDEDRDFVIGSRFIEGGSYGGDMPLYRKFSTRLHPWLLSLVCRRKISESTNGFRAVKVSLLRDPRLDLEQRWLDHYELEVYLLMKVILLGYDVAEVPCTKIYPPRRAGITKMRPIIDWWKMLRPIVYLALGLKR